MLAVQEGGHGRKGSTDWQGVGEGTGRGKMEGPQERGRLEPVWSAHGCVPCTLPMPVSSIESGLRVDVHKLLCTHR